MPTYEYECDKCKTRFDAFQNMTDKPLKKCPECKGRVRRLISSGSGIIFKGSGFYETDYKKKDRKEDKPGPSCQPDPDACRHCPSNPSALRYNSGPNPEHLSSLDFARDDPEPVEGSKGSAKGHGKDLRQGRKAK